MLPVSHDKVSWIADVLQGEATKVAVGFHKLAVKGYKSEHKGLEKVSLSIILL